jgi:hypothetical protein
MEDSVERCLRRLDFRTRRDNEAKRLQREAKVKITYDHQLMLF